MGKSNRRKSINNKPPRSYAPAAVFTGSLDHDEMVAGQEAARNVFGQPDMGDPNKMAEIEQASWEDTSSNDSLVNMECECRVCKGMVFWYDIDPSIDKTSNHMRTVKGRSFWDRRVFGKRPWLVLSDVDPVNHMVLVAPFTTGRQVGASPASVECMLAGKSTSLVLSCSTAVNSMELCEYMTWMTPIAMEKVTRTWLFYLGVEDDTINTYQSKTEAMRRIEEILEQAIDAKIDDVKMERFTDQDVDDVLVRAMATLQSRCTEAISKSLREAKMGSPVVQSGATDTVDVISDSIKRFYDKFPEQDPNRKKQAASVTDSQPTTVTPIQGSFVKKKSQYVYRSKATPSQFIDGVLDKGLDSKGHPRKCVKWTPELASMFLNDLAARSHQEIERIWGFDEKRIQTARNHIRHFYNM